MHKSINSHHSSNCNPLILPAAAETEWRFSHTFSARPEVATRLTIGIGLIAFLLVAVRAW